MSVTVVIPTIPPRVHLVERAVRSVAEQTRLPKRIVVQLDEHRLGAAATRNKALVDVDTEWVAFVDDDDLIYPEHLRKCLKLGIRTGADVVYPGYDTDGEDPVKLFGYPFNKIMLQRVNFIPVTTVCRTAAVRAAGGFQPHPDEHGDPCEDWGLWLAMLRNGAKFVHLPERTWLWNLAGESTRGRPDRW